MIKNTSDSGALYAGKSNYRPNENSSYNSKKKKNLHLFCDHCKLHGHTREIRYRLIGYPADWKFKKKPGPGQGITNTGKGIANHIHFDKGINDRDDVFGPVDPWKGPVYYRQ